MQFTFDSQNPTELRAVEAAVAVLVSGLATPERLILEDVVAKMKDLPGAVVSDDGLTVTGSGTVETIRFDTLDAVASINPTHENCEGVDFPELAESLQAALEVDSAGQPWDAELHSSTRSKLQDGTWRKLRTAAQKAAATKAFDGLVAAPVPPIPPAASNGELPDLEPTRQALNTIAPPAPPATDVVTMNQIWALISGNKATLNDVLAAAQRMGFADLGAVAQTATAEQRAALLKELTV